MRKDTFRKILSIVIVIIIFTGIYLVNVKDKEIDKIKVGIVDSGCSKSQEVIEYRSFTNITYDYPSNDDNLYDIFKHGEYICEIIIDKSDVVDLYSAKVAHSSGILTYKGLFAAMKWLVDDIGVDVINLSLGSSGILNEELIEAFDEYKDKVVIIAASGNTGSTSESSEGKGDWPAILPWVIGVGSYLNDTPAYFTAKGRGYSGVYTTEFSATGSYRSKFGTSFSTPFITASMSNLMYKLSTLNYNYRTSDLISILSRIGDEWNNEFHPDIGWGGISDEYVLENYLNTSINIQGLNSTDTFLRFSDESWEIKYKLTISDFSDTLSGYEPSFSGNGSSLISSSVINTYNWGSILQLNINADGKSGNYSINMDNKFGNSISYSFQITNISRGKILFDYRSSVNAYGHRDGEFSMAERYLRSMGYIVNHLFMRENLDLEKYNMVIAPKFFQVDNENSGVNIRSIDDNLIQSYLNYIKNGGYMIALTDVVSSTRNKDIEILFDQLGAKFTDRGIHNDYNPISISNFSNSPLMEGIVNIDFKGQEIINIGNNTELGWSRQLIKDILSSRVDYRSIGIYGNYFAGEFIIFGSTYPMSNDNFNSNGNVHFDRLLYNILF